MGIAAVAAGMVLATLSELLITLPGLHWIIFSYRWRFCIWRDPGIVLAGKMLLPILMATGASQMGLFVDRILGFRPSGGQHRRPVCYGEPAGAVRSGDLRRGRGHRHLPDPFPMRRRRGPDRPPAGAGRRGCACHALHHRPGVGGTDRAEGTDREVLFQWGAFDARATGSTAYALLFFSLGMAPMALRDLASRVYFSLQDTLTPMWLGIGAVALNIGLNFLLIARSRWRTGVSPWQPPWQPCSP